MASTFEKMDRMYRYQRYFYDLTRKFYLLGRDRLLAEMPVNDGDAVLEIGCGTARNLVILAKKYPQARFFGLDASEEMLETARAKIDSAGLTNITLARALAGDFHWRETFGFERPFDTVFFSYSLSMIPDWRAAIENALANLSAGGRMFIVDFYDQADLPVWFQKILKWWLAQFHVRYDVALVPHLRDLDGTKDALVKDVFRRYAFLARIEKL